MTDKQQIKVLAELDGLHIPEWDDDDYSPRCNKCGHSPATHKKIPPYLTRYDAIIPLIQKQSRDIRIAIDRFVSTHTIGSGSFYDVTPAKLCEALLCATGKWTE